MGLWLLRVSRCVTLRRKHHTWISATTLVSMGMNPQTDTCLFNLFGIEFSTIQSPMTCATTPEMVIPVSDAGGLGSLPGALYAAAQVRRASAAPPSRR